MAPSLPLDGVHQGATFRGSRKGGWFRMEPRTPSDAIRSIAESDAAITGALVRGQGPHFVVDARYRAGPLLQELLDDRDSAPDALVGALITITTALDAHQGVEFVAADGTNVVLSAHAVFVGNLQCTPAGATGVVSLARSDISDSQPARARTVCPGETLDRFAMGVINALFHRRAQRTGTERGEARRRGYTVRPDARTKSAIDEIAAELDRVGFTPAQRIALLACLRHEGRASPDTRSAGEKLRSAFPDASAALDSWLVARAPVPVRDAVVVPPDALGIAEFPVRRPAEAEVPAPPPLPPLPPEPPSRPAIYANQPAEADDDGRRAYRLMFVAFVAAAGVALALVWGAGSWRPAAEPSGEVGGPATAWTTEETPDEGVQTEPATGPPEPATGPPGPAAAAAAAPPRVPDSATAVRVEQPRRDRETSSKKSSSGSGGPAQPTLRTFPRLNPAVRGRADQDQALAGAASDRTHQEE